MTNDPGPLLLVHRSLLTAVAVSTLAGALATLSLSPYDYWIVLPVAFSILVWLLDGAGAQRSFWRGLAIGWAFAFGYFVPSLWWISEAFWVEPEKFAALIPFAVAGLPSYLALYWGVACGIATRLWPGGIARLLFLVLLLSIAEWLRGHMLTGFPWNLPGYGVSSLDGFSQVASVVGIYGLTTIIMLAAMSPAAFWQHGRATRMMVSGSFAGLVVALVVSLGIWGNARISSQASLLPDQGRMVRLVQPSIPQHRKWDPAWRQHIIDTYIAMSKAPWPDATSSGPALLVWPESALPVLLAEEHDLRNRIASLLPAGGVLFTGGLHRVIEPDGTASIYNSLLAIGQAGQVLGRHDKVRLVPFGEFLPFAYILEPLGIRQLANLPGGFREGATDRVIQVAGAPSFAGFICYEAVFPRSIPWENRPELLLNVTNDAWFGTSGGPHQHLAQSRFRAIEQGVPMVRAANTGISALIDSFGRVRSRINLGDAANLDVRMPPSIGATLYSRLGDLAFVLLLLGVLMANLICRRNNL